MTGWSPPHGDHVRVDSHAFAGYEVPPYYDSLIAKLIVSGDDRAHAIAAMVDALDAFVIEGIETTRKLQRAVMTHDDFRRHAVDTRWLETTLLPDLDKRLVAIDG